MGSPCLTKSLALAGLCSSGHALLAPYATWAHSHFVWLSSDGEGCTPAANLALLDGYAAHNITVGALNIDSGWSTGYNNFVPSPDVYPDFNGFVTQLHARNVRVILWMTSMIDTDSPNFAEAEARGAFVRDALGVQYTGFKWWHGTGGLLDYTNASTRAWWEAQMAAHVLDGGGDGGIDGWKCDGSDPLVLELGAPRGSDGRFITYPEYSHFYYNHTLYYTRSLKPDALIWSRPVDAFPVDKELNLSAFLSYSPKNVMFAGWVGDDDPNFVGLRRAIVKIFESAWQNYTNFGSDTGGYRLGNRSREVFVRWAQLNAFLPLFENGGNGDHTPWSFDAAAGGNTTEVTDMYRRLVNAHYSLVPYMFSTGTAAYAAKVSSITPSCTPPVDFPFILQPDEVRCWDYSLGADLFVSPIVFENVTEQNVPLPPGATGGWVDFWDPTNTFPSPANITYQAPLMGDMLHPVFHRKGALLPLHVSVPLSLVPRGSAAWAPALTLLAAGVGEEYYPGNHDVGDGGDGDADDADLHRHHDSTGGARPVARAVVAAQGKGEGEGDDRGVDSVAVEVSTDWGASPDGRRCGGGSATLRATPFDRPLVLLLRRYARGGCGTTAGGGSVRATSLGGEAGVAREMRETAAPEEFVAEGRRGAAVAWESAAASGGRYPRGARGAATAARDQFEATLAGTFWVAAGSAFEEVAVFVSAEDAARGAVVELVWLE